MELTRVTKFNLNIVAAAEVLSYTYSGDTPREVIARVDLGDDAKPIAGNATYSLFFYINDVLITPNNTITVPDVNKTIMVSRAIPIDTDDVITIDVIGTGADTAIDTVASLRDATPITINDVTGDGSVLVDENYGGTANLSYKTSGGAGVSGATILVYLTDDYEANNRGNDFVVAKTTTVTGGGWAFALNLNPDDYTLIYYRTGAYGPDRKDITVS